jgi:hypothetical protein
VELYFLNRSHLYDTYNGENRLLQVQGSSYPTLNLEPATLNLEPATLNLEPATLNLEPATLNLQQPYRFPESYAQE